MSAPASSVSAAVASSSSSTAAARSSAVAPSKRSKQAHPSAAVHVADDAPFVPHTTHSTFYAAPSACACGLATGTARILICGDGDLSYSVGLVRHLVSDAHRERPLDQAQGAFTFHNFTSEADARALRAHAASQPIGDLTEAQRQVASELQLTCTTYEEIETLSARYAEAHSNAELLRSWGIKVLHGVDARKLHEYSNLMSWSAARGIVLEPDRSTVASSASRDSIQYSVTSTRWSCLHRFHHIVFHFPHVGGKSRIHLNRALLTEFLQSASTCLVREGGHRVHRGQVQSAVDTRPGCVHVSLIRGQGGTPCDTRQRPNYGDHWQQLECGTKAGLVLTHVFPFVDALYPSYNNRGFRSRNEEFFWRGVAITHVLTPGSVASDSSKGDAAEPVIGGISTEQHPHHPLSILRAQMTKYWLDRADTGASNTLAAAGFRRQPFASEEISPVIDAELLRRLEWIDGAASASSSPFPHVTASPTVPVQSRGGSSLRPDLLVHLDQLLQQPTSTVLVGDVYEDCHHLDSLQWNLEPLQSAAADMEAELPRPIATQIKQQTTPAVVPFMRGGIPRLSHSLMVQAFTSSGSVQAEALSGVRLAELLHADLAESIEGCFTSTLQLENAFRLAVASSTQTLRLSPSVGDTAPRDVRFSTELHVHHRGVWHVVGRAGGFIFKTHVGWVCELSNEKLAMLRFDVDDPRLLRVLDRRLLEQLSGTVASPDGLTRFPSCLSFSLHPLAYVRDFSFWLRPTATAKDASSSSCSSSSAAPISSSSQALSPDVVYCAFVRLAFELFGDRCCSLTRTDDFIHPQRGPSMRLRCLFHSVAEALSPQRVLDLQEELKRRLTQLTGVEMR